MRASGLDDRDGRQRGRRGVPKADGVQLTKTPTSNGGDEYVVTFSDVAVDDVLGPAPPRTGSTSWRWP